MPQPLKPLKYAAEYLSVTEKNLRDKLNENHSSFDEDFALAVLKVGKCTYRVDPVAFEAYLDKCRSRKDLAIPVAGNDRRITITFVADVLISALNFRFSCAEGIYRRLHSLRCIESHHYQGVFVNDNGDLDEIPGAVFRADLDDVRWFLDSLDNDDENIIKLAEGPLSDLTGNEKLLDQLNQKHLLLRFAPTLESEVLIDGYSEYPKQKLNEYIFFGNYHVPEFGEFAEKLLNPRSELRNFNFSGSIEDFANLYHINERPVEFYRDYLFSESYNLALLSLLGIHVTLSDDDQLSVSVDSNDGEL